MLSFLSTSIGFTLHTKASCLLTSSFGVIAYIGHFGIKPAKFIAVLPVFVYANIYDALKRLTEKYKDMSYVIYNKTSNIPENLDVSTNIEDLNHGSYDEISKQYDEISKRI